jgi:hypothetical protein
MKPISIAILLGGLFAGCANEPAGVPAQAVPQAREHHLAWADYDGTGDAARAVFLLDGERLGRGPVGLDALRKRIAAMPRGSTIYVDEYYGDPGGSVRRTYPFDEADLHAWSAKYGVVLAVQGAG